MAYNLLPWERGQGYLMPPSLLEWAPEGDLAWFIVDTADQLDLTAFSARYRKDGWGAAAYDPKVMVGVLLYAYCQGMRSSRKIARALERDVGFRVVATNQQPVLRFAPVLRARMTLLSHHLPVPGGARGGIGEALCRAPAVMP